MGEGKSYPKSANGKRQGPARSPCPVSGVSLSPASLGEGRAAGEGSFCISCPVCADGEEPYVYDELPPPRAASPGLIHRVVSPAHVPDGVRASILTDDGMGELRGQEKTG